MPSRAAAPDLAGRRLGMFFGAYFALVGILAPYMPLYFEHRGLTAVQIGLLMAMAQAMRMVGPNLWGWLADRSGHRTRILRITSLALLTRLRVNIRASVTPTPIVLILTPLPLTVLTSSPLLRRLARGHLLNAPAYLIN